MGICCEDRGCWNSRTHAVNIHGMTGLRLVPRDSRIGAIAERAQHVEVWLGEAVAGVLDGDEFLELLGNVFAEGGHKLDDGGEVGVVEHGVCRVAAALGEVAEGEELCRNPLARKKMAASNTVPGEYDL